MDGDRRYGSQLRIDARSSHGTHWKHVERTFSWCSRKASLVVSTLESLAVPVALKVCYGDDSDDDTTRDSNRPIMNRQPSERQHVMS